MTSQARSAQSSVVVELDVLGPWSLATSKAFWEGFAPASLPSRGEAEELRTVFVAEGDWQRAEAVVRQDGDVARIALSGSGDLHAAAEQVARFLSLDVDARAWPDVGDRDPVIADAQRTLPGLRPCGFHSPYEAAAWAVLSQRIQMTQAASLRRSLIERYGDDGAFPGPGALRTLDLDLPGRKNEYLHAVADAALEGTLDGSQLRAMAPAAAMQQVQQIKGLGPFAAELVVIRGANAPDIMPSSEGRLNDEIVQRYGPDRSPDDISDLWTPFRSWAAVHLRALRAIRLSETSMSMGNSR